MIWYLVLVSNPNAVNCRGWKPRLHDFGFIASGLRFLVQMVLPVTLRMQRMPMNEDKNGRRQGIAAIFAFRR